MSGLYASVLPLALGAAVSPTLLTVELLLLSGKTQPKARAWLFAVGATTFLLGFALVCLLFLRKAPDADGGPVNPWSIAIKAVIVLLLVGLGARQLRPSKTAGEQHQSRVAARLQTAKLPFFFVVGLVSMATNFSTLVLYVPAVHEITVSTDDVATKVGVGVMLLVITLAPIYLPVLAVSLLGHRSDAVLAKLNAYVSAHSRQIDAVICFAFAALVAYSAYKQWAG